MGKTNIEWATHSWNPYSWNCTKVSEGCKNCYAEALSERYNGKNSNGASFLGERPVFLEKRLKELTKFPAGSVIFVNSMSDTFHEKVPGHIIRRILSAPLLFPDLIFLVLTKRPRRIAEVDKQQLATPNLWFGTSIEMGKYLPRIDDLANYAPEGRRFLSLEPLLEPLPYLISFVEDVNWIIVGAESGKNRRAFDPRWVRPIRDLCVDYDIPFMYKQGSHNLPGQNRLLDGRTWDETPFSVEEV